MKPVDLATLVAVLAPLAIIVHWLTDATKDVTNRNWNGLLTKGLAVAISVGVVVIAAHSSLDLGGGSLSVLAGLGWADELLIGLLIAATGGTVIENGLKAINRSDPSVSAKLIPPATGTGQADLTIDPASLVDSSTAAA